MTLGLPRATAGDSDSVARVRGLSIVYRGRRASVPAVRDVSFAVRRGEILGIVGETASGKTTVLKAIIGLLPSNAVTTGGAIWVAGHEVVAGEQRSLETLRGRYVGMVFQDPFTALNPVLTVGEQVGEGLQSREHLPRRELRRRVLEALERVGVVDEARLRAYPHELSGGLRQRVAIAAALIQSPSLLLADEPTTALDVTIQDQILTLIRGLCESSGMSVVMVTHDLGIVAQTCTQVAVMYAGRIVETGSVEVVMARPAHPYTAALLASIPKIGAPKARLEAIPGAPPDLTERVSGCPFAARCRFVIDACRAWDPVLEQHAPDHLAACLRHGELATALANTGS